MSQPCGSFPRNVGCGSLARASLKSTGPPHGLREMVCGTASVWLACVNPCAHSFVAAAGHLETKGSHEPSGDVALLKH